MRDCAIMASHRPEEDIRIVLDALHNHHPAMQGYISDPKLEEAVDRLERALEVVAKVYRSKP
jgi:hypothetical protein